MCVLHAADVSGPAKTLAPRIELLATTFEVEVVLPGEGSAAALYTGFARTRAARYEALTRPRSLLGGLGLGVRLVLQTAAFAARFARARPAVVLVGSTYLPSALLAARVLRVPAVVYVGEILDPTQPFNRGLRLLVERGATAIVACSNRAAASFNRTDVTVIRPGVARPATAPGRDESRAALGVPHDAYCIASVGSITRGRGQDVLLEAFSRLARPAFCVVAGAPHPRAVDHAYATELRALAGRLGVEDRVRFPGHVDRDLVYAAADVFVNPARFPEPFGRAAVEAAAAGLPVVSTAVGAVPEIFTDGADALLVPAEDVEALSAALVRLRDNDALRNRLVARAADVVGRSDVHETATAFARCVLAAAGYAPSRGASDDGS